MLKTFLIFLLFGVLTSKQRLFSFANECALNTECRPIGDCPQIRNNINLISNNKPYCNLNQKDTYVCCYKPPEKYTQRKDEGIRAVSECKSYQRYRTSCEKPLIVNGEKANPKEFPFTALLLYKKDDLVNYICVGTLISNKYVLTAAHCLEVGSPPNTVRLGELDYSTTTDDASPVDYEIKNTITHPEYFIHDIQEKYNDIALVELGSEVQFNDYIMPACLPSVDGREFQEYLVAGWDGLRDTSTGMAPYLRKVKLNRLATDTCNTKVEKTDELEDGVNNRTQMCAVRSDKRDTCSGISGSPLFVDHPDYKCLYLAQGITSFSIGGCNNYDLPIVYTRIQFYVDWIEKIVWK